MNTTISNEACYFAGFFVFINSICFICSNKQKLHMNDYEFFSKVDAMLSETLTIKPLIDICKEFEIEISNMVKTKYSSELFTKNKEHGNTIVKRFIEDLGYTFLSKSEKNINEYKFLKKGKEFIFEINTELTHMIERENDSDSRNMVIEYQNNGKDSGLRITNADFAVTYYPLLNEIWLIKIEKLKQLINENRNNVEMIEKHEVKDSDGYTKMFFLKIKNNNVKEQFRVTSPYKEETVNM